MLIQVTKISITIVALYYYNAEPDSNISPQGRGEKNYEYFKIKR